MSEYNLEKLNSLQQAVKVFSPKIISSKISDTRASVSSGYPNTEKRVEHATRSRILLTKFEVCGLRHCLECLIYQNSQLATLKLVYLSQQKKFCLECLIYLLNRTKK